MFEGRTINQIKPIGGLIAGEQKTYELWTCGSIVYINNPKDVQAIDSALREAKRKGYDSKNYLQYMIDEEGLFEE